MGEDPHSWATQAASPVCVAHLISHLLYASSIEIDNNKTKHVKHTHVTTDNQHSVSLQQVCEVEDLSIFNFEGLISSIIYGIVSDPSHSQTFYWGGSFEIESSKVQFWERQVFKCSSWPLCNLTRTLSVKQQTSHGTDTSDIHSHFYTLVPLMITL